MTFSVPLNLSAGFLKLKIIHLNKILEKNFDSVSVFLVVDEFVLLFLEDKMNR